jgi:hypothetical protein
VGDNGRKYDNIQRSKAIAALEESCRVVKGELKPHFREVERLRGMPGKTTLRRWWRDHQEDEEKRRKNQQNRGASGSGDSQNRPHLSARYEERERSDRYAPPLLGSSLPSTGRETTRSARTKWPAPSEISGPFSSS